MRCHRDGSAKPDKSHSGAEVPLRAQLGRDNQEKHPIPDSGQDGCFYASGPFIRLCCMFAMPPSKLMVMARPKARIRSPLSSCRTPLLGLMLLIALALIGTAVPSAAAVRRIVVSPVSAGGMSARAGTPRNPVLYLQQDAN